MQFIINLIAVVLLSLAITQYKTYAQEGDALEKCMDLNNITLEELRSLRPGEDDVERKYKCLYHCMGVEMGFFDEIDKVNPEKVKAAAGLNDTDMAILMTCKAKHDMEEDPCEYSYQMMKCQS